MADIKVEDYANEAAVIDDLDLFDLTVDLGGGLFESQRLKFATLKLILLGVRRFIVNRSFNDYAIAALTNNLELFELPAGFELVKRTAKHSTAWGGGGATLVESRIGTLTAGQKERYSPGGAFDIFQAPGDTPDKIDHNTLGFLENWGAVTSIREFIDSDVNLDTLASGDTQHILYIDQIK